MSKSEFEKFKKTWETQIDSIKNEAIDGDGVFTIRLSFGISKSKLELSSIEESIESIFIDLDLLESQLNVALEIAHSRFRLKNRGVLARLFGGALDKIPRK
jgi:hypothetical protein